MPAMTISQLRTFMQRQFDKLRQRRAIRAATPEELFGFRAEDVVKVYLHKRGFGRGLWFRLNDGRVLDAKGRPTHSERHWYEAAVH